MDEDVAVGGARREVRAQLRGPVGGGDAGARGFDGVLLVAVRGRARPRDERSAPRRLWVVASSRGKAYGGIKSCTLMEASAAVCLRTFSCESGTTRISACSGGTSGHARSRSARQSSIEPSACWSDPVSQRGPRARSGMLYPHSRNFASSSWDAL